MTGDGNNELGGPQALQSPQAADESQAPQQTNFPDAADIAAWETDEKQDLDGRLRVDVEGFEGPLDLLLTMARSQKVDLAKISVLSLAQQYIKFIEEAKRLRLELAADYLVMAAWLTFLKSKLLLPPEPSEEGEPSG